jgi:hypothetical protein
MSPRFIYVLQVITLALMVASSVLPPKPHIAALAIGAIIIERTFKPLCVYILMHTH